MVSRIVREHEVGAIIHFAGSIVVPDLVRDPLSYYRNNTVNSRALIECAVLVGCATSSSPRPLPSMAIRRGPVKEDAPTQPISPYGWSKLMTETMLRDSGRAHGLRHVILRYFNVAGADPQRRTGQSSKAATHLIKVAVETVLGTRPSLTFTARIIRRPTAPACATTFMSATWCARRRCAALSALWRASLTLNCGYGHGFSVLEVIEAVKRVSGIDFKVETAPRRAGNSARIVAASEQVRATLGWQPRYDDLATIVGHALAWERMLMARPSEQRTAI